MGFKFSNNRGTGWRGLRMAGTAAVALALMTGNLAVPSHAAAAPASLLDVLLPPAGPSQPGQPASGPGGSDYTHSDYTVSQGGFADDAWYVFEPTAPAPASAPVAIITHGWSEFAGYDMMKGLIEHTVRKGTIVIYPRWQASPVTPCQGSLTIDLCVNSALKGIRGALEHLQSDPARVQPQVDRASYFGFSFGGILTTNLVNRWQAYNLPEPKAVFLDDPHDGGHFGYGEPGLDDSLGGIPSSTLFQCHVGAEGIISDVVGIDSSDPTQLPGSKQLSSCNAIFPKLGHIPAQNKDLVLTYPDTHGQPALSSKHGVCQGGTSNPYFGGPADAYDWNFCWKVWDALRGTANDNRKDSKYALGNTLEHRSHGFWTDGTPVVPLKIQDEAPIAP